MGIMDDNRRLEEADKKYVWHPFTQMQAWEAETPIIITEGLFHQGHIREMVSRRRIIFMGECLRPQKT
jgi:hypothetical protein